MIDGSRGGDGHNDGAAGRSDDDPYRQFDAESPDSEDTSSGATSGYPLPEGSDIIVAGGDVSALSFEYSLPSDIDLGSVFEGVLDGRVETVRATCADIVDEAIRTARDPCRSGHKRASHWRRPSGGHD